MARKNLLTELMQTEASSLRSAANPDGGAGARGGASDMAKSGSKSGIRGVRKGAIGAVSQSIADLRARAVEELDPHQIDAGGMLDRVEHDEGDHARLMESLATYGQQVPVLVRPHPETSGRYQIVYGRRRVLAARDLGLRIKAMIRDLDDRDLVLAQGQENTARRDLSFIEKANFARQMQDEGYDRKIIADALSVDKTALSRMLSIAARVPEQAIYAIGAAPGIGRDRWQQLADLIAETETTGQEAGALAYGKSSDARFEALVKALTLPQRRRAEMAATERSRTRTAARWISGEGGARIGRVRSANGQTTLTLKARDGFADWLVDELPDLYKTWQARGE